MSLSKNESMGLLLHPSPLELEDDVSLPLQANTVKKPRNSKLNQTLIESEQPVFSTMDHFETTETPKMQEHTIVFNEGETKKLKKDILKANLHI